MKIKYWILCLVICFVAEAGIVITVVADQESTKVDLVEINERYMQTMELLEQSAAVLTVREQAEETYGCEIYLKSDIDYQTKVSNAIRNQDILMDFETKQGEEGKLAFSEQMERIVQWKKTVVRKLVLVSVVLFLIVCIFFFVLYRQYVYPFKKLEKFAGYISKGNFDIPLPIKKGNYFGAFTESFDMMREEMKRARESEYQANISKKELVASLSHDIKTPIATIKAICELLEIKLADELEKEKIRVILQKADMIDHLISDMFQATLQDLERLKINVSEELSLIIEPMFMEINYHNQIHMKNHVPECMILVDALRLNQVIDNLINNAYKYAESEIDVWFEKGENWLKIFIQDYGEGMKEDELLLVTEKFYRGSNADKKEGSGLGLYLSKTFMKGMGGHITIENNHGLLVTLSVPIA